MNWSEASTILQGLIEEIRLVPVEGELRIHLKGSLAEMLAFSLKDEHPGSGSQFYAAPVMHYYTGLWCTFTLALTQDQRSRIARNYRERKWCLHHAEAVEELG